MAKCCNVALAGLLTLILTLSAIAAAQATPDIGTLDCLVVADHSDTMGFFPDLLADTPDLLAHPTERKCLPLSMRVIMPNVGVFLRFFGEARLVGEYQKSLEQYPNPKAVNLTEWGK